MAQAREALRGGDPDTAAGLLARAGATFRGPPYDGVPEGAVPVGEVQRLVELRDAITEDGAEADLERGLGALRVGELEAFVQANPYRERAWGLLMRALYQAGRPADALAAFGRARLLLAADLGIEPGSALRDDRAGRPRPRPDAAGADRERSGSARRTSPPRSPRSSVASSS